MKTKILISIILIFAAKQIFSQLSEIYLNKDLIFNEAVEHYKNHNFINADHSFSNYVNNMRKNQTDDLFTIESKYYTVLMAFETDDKNCEDLLAEFEKNYSSGILINDAYIAEGNYFFRNKDYPSAIQSFEKIDLNGLEFYKEDEVKFKLAYSYFVKREFDKASVIFKNLSLIDRKYYYPANYYYGLCMFLNSDFERAINSFKIIQNTEEYKNYIPYYLVQLYFYQGDYDKAIETGEEKLKLPQVENLKPKT